ncbi:ABC transporter permease [Acetobacter estunensis]|uniref:ABC transporter permease n=1 Tax=Acetobacter estunensis TaxID=104097 RepID=UPI001C2D3475|nr:ABC transporter permease [Acetobacter estunensis]MBV1837922.1 ABC transporter permease [Acetobacter estunensis]
MKRDRRLFDVTLNAPSLFIVLSVIVFPILFLGLLSLKGRHDAVFSLHFTLANFTKLATSHLYWLILERSVFLAGFVTVFTILMAYPVAYFIAFKGGAKKNLLLLIVTLPFWTSYLLRVFAWKVLLGYNGVINSALVLAQAPGAPFQALLYTPQAMVLTLTHAYAAFAILPLYVSLSAIEPKLIEAANDLGAGTATAFRRVVLPLSLPGILSAAVLVFIPTMGDYATPTLVGGTNSSMIGNMIQAQFGKANNWPYGAAISISSMVITAGIAFIVFMVAKRKMRHAA